MKDDRLAHIVVGMGLGIIGLFILLNVNWWIGLGVYLMIWGNNVQRD